MCALFGYLDCGKRVPMRTLQKLVQALANASEVRGHHAAGIAYNYNSTLRIFKRPKPAHRLRFRIPDGTAAVMGHTRYTTQGTQKRNCNNHPFRGNAGTEFALAHNGVLYNDTELRLRHSLPDTDIETDSYIAVQLIESQQELNFDSLRYAAEQVRGYFTFTVLDERDNLYIIKGESPLCLVYYPSLGLYVYASTKEILTEALKHLHVRMPRGELIPLDEGELLRIGHDGIITRERYTVHEDDYLLLYRHWYGSYLTGFDETPDAHDEDYLMLAELCGYYGVDPDTVRQLRDLGYSYDEIEEVISMPDEYGVGCLCEEM